MQLYKNQETILETEKWLSSDVKTRKIPHWLSFSRTIISDWLIGAMTSFSMYASAFLMHHVVHMANTERMDHWVILLIVYAERVGAFLGLITFTFILLLGSIRVIVAATPNEIKFLLKNRNKKQEQLLTPQKE